MEVTQQTDDSESVAHPHGVRRGSLRNSILLKLALLGGLLIALGALINEGVWAAVITVWGAGLVLAGLGFYGFIWWRRR
ncbi:hypothetical protein [Natrialba taiwanensis]|uniref:Uncharacterized protein n=1 Tax=Natrialba taiwanensis DSM 12281 TaxID=1230458 RepID=M0A2V7_9EURY|nr:hypothetical protein [Natrialba taiwanensis]ELY92197.1 hypothetical protein C484_09411 [Natrialba taiwanensis DSM 12281]